MTECTSAISFISLIVFREPRLGFDLLASALPSILSMSTIPQLKTGIYKYYDE